jgi:hypothetical protein
MATTKKRFVFHADPGIASWLEVESARTGCPVAELCRRAVRLAAFGEAQTAKQQRPVSPGSLRLETGDAINADTPQDS